MRPIAGQHLLFPLPRLLAERFGAAFFRGVPERPGVYLLASEAGGVLYVGKARNLRQRLGAYRAALPERLPARLRRVLPAVTRITWDECADEAAAVVRERALLLTLRPRGNTAGVYSPPRPALAWTAGPAGLSFGHAALLPESAGCLAPRPGTRGTHAALLRLLWWTAHPGAGTAELPHRLAGERPPTAWTLPAEADAAAALGADLARLSRGDHDAVLAGWLTAAAPTERFAVALLAADAETVRGFLARPVRGDAAE